MVESDVKDKVVLEVACGRGDFSLEASKYALSIDCIDLDEFRLNKNILKVSNIKFRIMNAIDMDYKNEIFDTVVIYNAIMHIDYCREQVINESLRVLKKNGTLYIISSFSIDKSIIDSVYQDIIRNDKLRTEYISYGNFKGVKIKKY